MSRIFKQAYKTAQTELEDIYLYISQWLRFFFKWPLDVCNNFLVSLVSSADFPRLCSKRREYLRFFCNKNAMLFYACLAITFYRKIMLSTHEIKEDNRFWRHGRKGVGILQDDTAQVVEKT